MVSKKLMNDIITNWYHGICPDVWRIIIECQMKIPLKDERDGKNFTKDYFWKKVGV